MANAPEGFEETDLSDPECWDGSKVRVHDHVYVIGPDMAWSADGVIVWTDNPHASFSMTKRHRFDNQRAPLFNTDEYRVEALGGAFDVVRKKDGQRMKAGLATEAVAKAELMALYPKKVA